MDVRLELLAGWVALGGQSLMRVATLRQAGGWREDLSVAEDQELWLRMVAHGPVAIVPRPVLLHRPHGLAGDSPDARDVERSVVAAHLAGMSEKRKTRSRRAANAREHLRDAYIAFQLTEYRRALVATLRGLAAAPFLVASPLVGPGIARGLANVLVAVALPRTVAERLRAEVHRKRSLAYSARAE